MRQKVNLVNVGSGRSLPQFPPKRRGPFIGKGIEKRNAIFGQTEKYRIVSGMSITPISGLKTTRCRLRRGTHRSLCRKMSPRIVTDCGVLGGGRPKGIRNGYGSNLDDQIWCYKTCPIFLRSLLRSFRTDWQDDLRRDCVGSDRADSR